MNMTTRTWWHYITFLCLEVLHRFNIYNLSFSWICSWSSSVIDDWIHMMKLYCQCIHTCVFHMLLSRSLWTVCHYCFSGYSYLFIYTFFSFFILCQGVLHGCGFFRYLCISSLGFYTFETLMHMNMVMTDVFLSVVCKFELLFTESFYDPGITSMLLLSQVKHEKKVVTIIRRNVLYIRMAAYTRKRCGIGFQLADVSVCCPHCTVLLLCIMCPTPLL